MAKRSAASALVALAALLLFAGGARSELTVEPRGSTADGLRAAGLARSVPELRAARLGPAPARSFIRSAGPAGATRTLILVNGGPGLDSQRIFRGFKGLASSSRRVVAYDQRGVGRTPAPRTPVPDYTLDAFVADLEALRVRLGVERVDVLGHSFGALVAAAYAATHPDRVRSLMLVSGLPMSIAAQYEGEARFQKRLRALQRKGLVPKVIPYQCSQSARALFPVYVGDPSRAGTIWKALGPFRCDDNVVTVASSAIASDPRRHELELALTGYRGAALVVIGARDPFGAAWAEDGAAPLRNARVTRRVISNAGHELWLETPAFFPLLRSFLAGG